MTVRFITPARKELNEAINYYNQQLPGLGYRFFQEISAAIERVKYMPKGWTKIGERTRRCIVKNFPYAILYIAEPTEIIITAIANLQREPDHYANRIL